MPQFVLDVSGGPVAFNSLPAFVRGYIEAAYFTGSGPDNVDENLGPESSYDDLAAEALETIQADCDTFLASLPKDADGRTPLDKAIDLDPDQYDEMRAGRDFWYTRNGHGVGFWDRALGALGDELSDYATAAGTSDLYRGDDGKIYVFTSRSPADEATPAVASI